MEILKTIKDRLFYREVPLAWDQFKQTLLERRLRGLIMAEAPRVFYVSKGMVAVFDEMLPVKKGRIDKSINTPAVQKAINDLEVARAIVTNPNGKSLLVQTADDGIAQYLENGSEIKITRRDRQFGSIHTHPRDGLPSMTDILTLLKPDNSCEIIVTPNRVIALFKTTDTPIFSSELIAEGYVMQMGRSKGKINRFDEIYTELSAGLSGLPYTRNGWCLNYQDLREINILGYQAKRGSDVFVLQNSKP